MQTDDKIIHEMFSLYKLRKLNYNQQYNLAATTQPMPDPVRRVGLNYCNFKGEQPNADTG